ncbi:membrane protease subunit, stomatin/prohibitin, partial [Methanocalculus chunghsingensis]|nr:membrane protease subunit, stomatin/prohibitin [Methanocalculus chunghsingensis]
RAAILSAEGLRQSMILEAEGDRQSKILRAEGDRQSKILVSQGEAQGLRIIALGSRSLDKRSITVLSLEALKKMAEGESTKIVLPFEISSLIKQSAKFLGATEDHMEETDSLVELSEELLGDMPGKDEAISSAQEILKDIEKIETSDVKMISKEKLDPKE